MAFPVDKSWNSLDLGVYYCSYDEKYDMYSSKLYGNGDKTVYNGISQITIHICLPQIATVRTLTAGGASLIIRTQVQRVILLRTEHMKYQLIYSKRK